MQAQRWTVLVLLSVLAGPARRLIPASLVSLIACVGPQAAAARDAVIGLEGRAVVRCMGPPDAIDYASESKAVWTYHRPHRTRSQDIEIQADIYGSQRHARQGPTVIRGDVERSNTVARRTASNAPRPGVCTLRFRLEEGLVVAFDSVGRTAANVNADTECTLLARECAEPEASP